MPLLLFDDKVVRFRCGAVHMHIERALGLRMCSVCREMWAELCSQPAGITWRSAATDLRTRVQGSISASSIWVSRRLLALSSHDQTLRSTSTVGSRVVRLSSVKLIIRKGEKPYLPRNDRSTYLQESRHRLQEGTAPQMRHELALHRNCGTNWHCTATANWHLAS